MEFHIRPYHPSDLTVLYRICLQTVDQGGDGSHLFSDPDLAGHCFIGPYVILEPELCFVLVGNERPYGYICGVRDIHPFRQDCEARWFPPLRDRYPRPEGEPATAEEEMSALIHEGIDLNEDVNGYPAQLHIALLPPVQRQGWGQLRALDVPAVHLEVSTGNQGAIKFYEVVGFHRIIEYPGAIEFGMHL